MPKFDTSKIPGYDSMTVEEKINALENATIPADQTDEVIKLKRNITLALSELHANRRTVEEQDGYWNEDAATHPNKAQERSELQKEIQIGRAADGFVSAGMDYHSALQLATAIENGDYESSSRLLSAFDEAQRLKNADAIKEAEEQAKLRRIFGLR